MVGLDRERVSLEPHRPAWREVYAAEASRLAGVLGDDLRRIEHVGSTAIPDVPAKPVVDVLALVEDPDRSAVTESIEESGYELRSDDGDRLFFARGPEDDRTHYLHVTAPGTEYAEEMVAFRDHLRRHPDVAAEYADLKRSLAERFPEDRDAYTEGKAAFVEGVLEEVLEGR